MGRTCLEKAYNGIWAYLVSVWIPSSKERGLERQNTMGLFKGDFETLVTAKVAS